MGGGVIASTRRTMKLLHILSHYSRNSAYRSSKVSSWIGKVIPPRLQKIETSFDEILLKVRLHYCMPVAMGESGGSGDTFEIR